MKALMFIKKHHISNTSPVKKYIQGNPTEFITKDPMHLCYNRLPLLANVIYDLPSYSGTGVSPQYSYDKYTSQIHSGDIVFVKTDLLTEFLDTTNIVVPIVLLTGVSDLSPSLYDYSRIIENPNISKWIGVNIPYIHPKITKILMSVGEPERINSNHLQLRSLHANRVVWDKKIDDVCIPYHGLSHSSRKDMIMLPKLDFDLYMKEITKYKFVVCKRGNGIDTHRFSEILLMGSVPVIEHSGLDDLYMQFPCIFEEDDLTTFIWDDIKYKKFLNMFWLDKTFFSNYLDITIN